MWNFWVGIPQKPFKWGQAAGPIPLILPLPRAVYSASVPPELLSTFLPLSLCSGSRRLTCMEPIRKYPCPLNFSKRWSLEGQRNQNIFSLGSLSVRPHVDSGCFPLSKGTALVRQASLTTTAAAHSGFLQLFPALTPSHLGVVMAPCCC